MDIHAPPSGGSRQGRKGREGGGSGRGGKGGESWGREIGGGKLGERGAGGEGTLPPSGLDLDAF